MITENPCFEETLRSKTLHPDGFISLWFLYGYLARGSPGNSACQNAISRHRRQVFCPTNRSCLSATDVKADIRGDVFLFWLPAVPSDGILGCARIALPLINFCGLECVWREMNSRVRVTQNLLGRASVDLNWLDYPSTLTQKAATKTRYRPKYSLSGDPVHLSCRAHFVSLSQHAVTNWQAFIF